MIVQNLALKKVIKSHLRIFQCIDDNHGSTLIRDVGAGADDPFEQCWSWVWKNNNVQLVENWTRKSQNYQILKLIQHQAK